MLLDRVRGKDTCFFWGALQFHWCSAHQGWAPCPEWSGSRAALPKHLHISPKDTTFQISGSWSPLAVSTVLTPKGSAGHEPEGGYEGGREEPAPPRPHSPCPIIIVE